MHYNNCLYYLFIIIIIIIIIITIIIIIIIIITELCFFDREIYRVPTKTRENGIVMFLFFPFLLGQDLELYSHGNCLSLTVVGFYQSV